MNPLHIIDSILSDYAAPRTRRTIHSLIFLLAILGGIWLAAEGNWLEAIAALIALVYAGANRANTPVSGNPEGGEPDWEYGDTGH